MELQIVNFEQANKLKDLGFPQGEAPSWYSERGVTFDWINGSMDDIKATKMFSDVDAPTLDFVSKWLRDNKKIAIVVQPVMLESVDGQGLWEYFIWNNHDFIDGDGFYDTYENALSKAINVVIEKLSK